MEGPGEVRPTTSLPDLHAVLAVPRIPQKTTSMSGSKCTVSYARCICCDHVLNVLSDGLSSLDALLTALANLDDLCLAIGEAYKTSLTEDDYEKWDEKS